MPTSLFLPEQLCGLFDQKKCWMIADLAQALGCAQVTVRRLLIRTGYYRSFTHNGKWYTLSGMPEFNSEGIWHYDGIGFSSKGSLTESIIALVTRSSDGLSAAQLAQKLQHPCHPVLTNLHKNGKLDRIKFAGEFHYLSVQKRVNGRQRARLALKAQAPSHRGEALSTRTALFVLVEYVKMPSLSFEQLAEKVHDQMGLRVSAESVRFFFEKEGLKKTPEGSPQKH